MKLTTVSFCLPKQGNRAEENEDAYYPTRDGEKQGPVLSFALADGATTAILSRHWARLLVKTFTSRRWSSPEQFLNTAYRRWDRWLNRYLEKRQLRNQPIAWYEEPGLREGAFATLLGVLFSEGAAEHNGDFTAYAVGDSCLFQIRDGALIRSFPIQSSSGFSSRPYLISSNPGNNRRLKENTSTHQGVWRSEDRFFLMTDALACWFTQQHEDGQKPWEVLRDLFDSGNTPAFYRWIAEQRREKTIRNDDVTLLYILMG